jgi:hypothetical protein
MPLERRICKWQQLFFRPSDQSRTFRHSYRWLGFTRRGSIAVDGTENSRLPMLCLLRQVLPVTISWLRDRRENAKHSFKNFRSRPRSTPWGCLEAGSSHCAPRWDRWGASHAVAGSADFFNGFKNSLGSGERARGSRSA